MPPELRELHSDLVYSCTIESKEALLLLLVEHQSPESWLIPLRFIRYQAAAIEDFLQGKPQATPWPIVVCACFYHGEVAPYLYSACLHDYFTDPALAQDLGAFAKFQLLKKAYIDARYKKEYPITADELQYLAERV